MWGLTAALVGTLVANAFYLTIVFYYFFVLAMLIIVAPAVFGRRLAPTRGSVAAPFPRGLAAIEPSISRFYTIMF